MGIPKEVMTRLSAVFEKEKSIERVFIYGSRARGDNRYNSDIDLALQGHNISRTVILDLKEAGGLYKVDAILLTDDLDEGFMEEFEKDSIVIYDREVIVTLQEV